MNDASVSFYSPLLLTQSESALLDLFCNESLKLLFLLLSWLNVGHDLLPLLTVGSTAESWSHVAHISHEPSYSNVGFHPGDHDVTK